MSSKTFEPPPRILLTGATGYIGGTVLNQLLSSDHHALATSKITCLIRDASRAETLSRSLGPDRISTVVYAGLDDTDLTTALAASHDLVINTTLGFHAASAQALLRGLAHRKAQTAGGRDVFMLHLSGASNLADQPVSRAYVETREFDDARDDVYAYEQMREAVRPYHQRTTELGVISAGLEMGVRTLVVMPPLVFGRGTGLFNRASVQIPVYVEAALGRGCGVVVGDGAGQLDHVHVEDLAGLYEVLVRDVLDSGGARVPWGGKGIVFAANGRHDWMEVARRVAEACFAEGQIPEARVERLTLEEGAVAFKSYVDLVGGDLTELELGLCENSRTVASVARNLGWKPTRGEDKWIRGFRDDVRAVVQRRNLA